MSDFRNPREPREEKETIKEQSIQDQSLEQNPSSSSISTQEWENRARDWLSTLQKGRNVTMNEVGAWIDSKQFSMPEELKSLPRSQIYEQILSIHKLMQQPNQIIVVDAKAEKKANEVEPAQARFQRTDQWRPVYSWLESLNKNQVVKSKEISDWLSENPKVKEQLYSRHSRNHLMHYIQKCHSKMLKRREKQKGLQHSNTTGPAKVHNHKATKLPVVLPCNSSSNLLKDNDIYLVRRKEAFLRYEMLVIALSLSLMITSAVCILTILVPFSLTELESQLTILLSKHKQVNLEPDSPSLLTHKDANNTNNQLFNMANEGGNIRITSSGASHYLDTEDVTVDGKSRHGIPLDS
ncbi:hypothetical protein HHK36_007572 [Tetracentron sinense]|uniref:Uncharacterized protein n=1 Tax=Tetracentron sinense TaxID=13715 RepID=A0A834ZMP4_TETSI|nr:hypothetical protein HHK36_007572 [Tetracentron sinense]